jgi:hypothetical protein
VNKKTLKQQAIRFVGTASIIYTAASYPSPVSAAPNLFGLVATGGAGVVAFGSIDPATDAFTQISTPGLKADGYYAPVYDPVRNAFFVTDQPISSDPSLGFSNVIDEIDAATGAVSHIHLPSGVGFGDLALGLGFDTARGQLVPPVIDSAVDFRIDGSAMTEMHRDRETSCCEEVCGEAQR